MKSNLVTLLLLTLSLFTTSCYIKEDSDCHKDLTFQNNSEEPLYFIFTEKVTPEDECNYFAKAEFEAGRKYNILGANKSCLETRINNVFNSGIILYVFNENPNIEECELVSINPNIIESREYTIEDLNAIDWGIRYPN